MKSSRDISYDVCLPLLERYRPPDDDVAETFHAASKFARSIIDRQESGVGVLVRSASLIRVTGRSSKRYSQLSYRPLSAPSPLTMSLDETLKNRQTANAFSGEPIGIAETEALLFAACGQTHTFDRKDETGTAELRSAPSAGALYPLDVYALVQNVEGLDGGLYHFDPSQNGIARIFTAEQTARVSSAFSQEALVTNAGVLFIIAATFSRNRFKYGLRSYRFMLLEAGHIAQNILLAATALGLSSVPIGGFYDCELEEILGFDGVNESIVYVVGAGR